MFLIQRRSLIIKTKHYQGDYYALLLARSTSEIKQVQNEYQQIVSKVTPEDPKNFNELSSNADLYTESFTRRILGNKNDSGIFYFYMIAGVFTLLFMILPTINLVNINVSRIMERSFRDRCSQSFWSFRIQACDAIYF